MRYGLTALVGTVVAIALAHYVAGWGQTCVYSPPCRTSVCLLITRARPCDIQAGWLAGSLAIGVGIAAATFGLLGLHRAP